MARIVQRPLEGERLGYQIVLPEGYQEERGRRWPLILFLHGINRRGEDLSLLDHYGLLGVSASNDSFNYIVLAPQCPKSSNWVIESDAVIALIDHVTRDFRVCTNQVYLTGFSMGGNGVWHLAAHYQQHFAAAAPLAGWYRIEEVDRLKDMPLWAFHGQEDDVVPVQNTQNLADALASIGGNIKLTCYDNQNHDIMNKVYSNSALYEWFKQYERRS
ncbi:prolyl oligopeptidase family serine peptidase [Cohnella boryungensis]|uniref:Prolyl oligopeptidase family serine peptidase n=1 Tax=Cohnella boryungensis TaxID=768479 RepID=A0ABV8SB03_9BACL